MEEEAAPAALGVPAREAAAEEGLVGDTEPPLERCEEVQPPSLTGEELVDAGMTALRGINFIGKWE